MDNAARSEGDLGDIVTKLLAELDDVIRSLLSPSAAQNEPAASPLLADEP